MENVTYKTVFQLAQEKGYKPSKFCFDQWGELIKNETSKNMQLVELTLIQKWYYDLTGKWIYVSEDEGIYRQGDKSFGYTIDEKHYKNGFIEPQQALLEGIHEALKLIP